MRPGDVLGATSFVDCPGSRDRSSGRPEPSETPLEILLTGTQVTRPRQLKREALHLLKPVAQHGPVLLLQHVPPHVNPAVPRYAHDVRVVGAVVDLAEAEPVGDFRATALVAIRKDVRGVEQLAVPEPAHGALAQQSQDLVRSPDRALEGVEQRIIRRPAGIALDGGAAREAERRGWRQRARAGRAVEVGHRNATTAGCGFGLR